MTPKNDGAMEPIDLNELLDKLEREGKTDPATLSAARELAAVLENEDDEDVRCAAVAKYWQVLAAWYDKVGQANVAQSLRALAYESLTDDLAH